MPKIKIDHIVSFSSEDPVHVASNILSNDITKKWKCQNAGEKTAVVVLQLEKASVITGIDIGNENSAYIEVFVSRTGMSDDYKVLLVMSSFMSPLEARQTQNVNKVRMFTQDQLSKPECKEKWDRVKVVCTQPFNRHVQFGLCFINLHTNEGKPATNTPTSNAPATLGKFLLRPDSPDNLSVGSVFARRKELQDAPLKGAAAIREASSSASLTERGSPLCKPKLKQSLTPKVTPKRPSLNESDQSTTPKPKARNRDELLYSKDEEERKEKIDKIIEKKSQEKREIQEKEEKKIKEREDKKLKEKESKKKEIRSKDTPKKNREDTRDSKNKQSYDSPSTSKEKDTKDNKRKHSNETEETKIKKPKKDKITKSFSSLLEGVTLTISGIQNPDRGNLRTMALSMGAKYKPDWDNSCSHLICAFVNTPKFNQVKGKGKIVTRKWIEDCYCERKRLPWRRYALDKNDKGKESEEEIWERSDVTPTSTVVERDDDTDIEMKEAGSDTEERIAKIQAVQQKKDKNKSPDIYSAETDEEDTDNEDSKTVTNVNKKPLKTFLSNKTIYIDETFEEELYNKLNQYVTAYDGQNDKVHKADIIITSLENSSTMKEINLEAICASPDWLWECHNCQKLVPFDDYTY